MTVEDCDIPDNSKRDPPFSKFEITFSCKSPFQNRNSILRKKRKEKKRKEKKRKEKKIRKIAVPDDGQTLKNHNLFPIPLKLSYKNQIELFLQPVKKRENVRKRQREERRKREREKEKENFFIFFSLRDPTRYLIIESIKLIN